MAGRTALSESNEENKTVSRAARYTSHALVELRKWRHLPFSVHSAVLLDLSVGGFKIEFTGDVTVKLGDVFWLIIPLTPLGIAAPEKLCARVECRWFDPKRYRVGGVFSSLDTTEKVLVERVVDTLRKRGKLAATSPEK